MRCRHAALALALSLISLSAADPTTGLGVNFKGDTSTLYVPFQLTPSLRLEGLMTFSHRSSSPDDTNKDLGIGAGLFHVRPLADDFQLYAGARFAYYTSKGSSHDVDYLKAHSYSVTPLVGIEYKMSRHFSLAGEAGVQGCQYQMKGASFPTRRDGTLWSSQTNLVFRTWF